MIPANLFKQRLAAGEPVCVMSVRYSRSVEIVAIAAASGHHALYVDLQHSALSLDTTSQICVAALAAGVTPLVRVPDHDPATIGRVLDGGALGIIAPDVSSAAEAEALVASCRFAPQGRRSASSVSPVTGYRELPFAEVAGRVNDATMLLTMIESEAAVAAAGAIAAVAGVNALFLGTLDLTASMGIPGETTHPKVRDAIGRAIGACRTHGKHLLVGGIRDGAILADYVALGAARCYFTGIDTQFLLAGARRAVAGVLRD